MVITDFQRLTSTYGYPAATLTDNGAVYTSRFTGGHNGFEYLLAHHGITQKNGKPNHPQTQGKMNRPGMSGDFITWRMRSWHVH